MCFKSYFLLFKEAEFLNILEKIPPPKKSNKVQIGAQSLRVKLEVKWQSAISLSARAGYKQSCLFLVPITEKRTNEIKGGGGGVVF